MRTGDEVYFNDLKEIFVVDRIKELIKVRGFQVPPAELEGHLLDHPDVGDVCVVGIPDEYSGELPLAFVSPSAEAEARIAKDPKAAEEVRKAIMKVRAVLAASACFPPSALPIPPASVRCPLLSAPCIFFVFLLLSTPHSREPGADAGDCSTCRTTR